MDKIGFNTDLYIKLQLEQIKEKLKSPAGKFYIEIGGKLIQDRHAARVLPGYREDARFEVVKELASDGDIILVVSAKDILRGRIRGDFKITYDKETIRTIQELRNRGLSVKRVVITMVEKDNELPEEFVEFEKKLEQEGIRVYRFFDSSKYRSSDLCLGDMDLNPFVETLSKYTLVISPGGGSGKFGVCLSQLYHEMKRGIAPYYFSLGAFPLYDLSIKHPLNLAYMAASADFKDSLSGDPKLANSVLTEREIANFNLLDQLTRLFANEGKYLREIGSASDMCVSALSKGIVDMDEVKKEAGAEIARRYMRYKIEVEKGQEKLETVEWVRKILSML